MSSVVAVCDCDDGDAIDIAVIVEVIVDAHCYYDITLVVGCIGFEPIHLFNNNNNNINNK